MPLNDAGDYVSIDPTTKQLLFEYMANLHRQGGWSNAEIIQKAGERFAWGGKLDGYDRPAMLSILQTSKRYVESGAATQSGLGPDGGRVPTIPGDPGRSGQYLYDVVIVATDPVTGERHSDRLEIYSEGRMSKGDIADLVEGNRDAYLRLIRSPAPKLGSYPDLKIETFVIGGGRVR